MGYYGERPPIPEEVLTGPENKPDERPDMTEGMKDGPEKKESFGLAVPENEIQIDFVRSSGPGGQKVNKTSSKAQLRWNVGASRAFTEEQKASIRAGAGNRLNNEDEIVLAAQTERSQFQNRDQVVQRLQDLVAEALSPKPERQPTEVSRSQKRQRLEEKRRIGDKKRDRKLPRGEW
jgi:ribosome-associated protein